MPAAPARTGNWGGLQRSPPTVALHTELGKVGSSLPNLDLQLISLARHVCKNQLQCIDLALPLIGA